MKKLTFSIEIDAPAEKVYKTMLGLENKDTYEYWTSAFNPTSTYEGSWDSGSKMCFVGYDKNGKKGGMISRIEAHQPARFVSILHYGCIDGDKEITTGQAVEKWAGAHENYSFKEINNKTFLTVELDAIDDFLDYFNQTYPDALKKLKAICE